VTPPRAEKPASGIDCAAAGSSFPAVIQSGNQNTERQAINDGTGWQPLQSLAAVAFEVLRKWRLRVCGEWLEAANARPLSLHHA